MASMIAAADTGFRMTRLSAAPMAFRRHDAYTQLHAQPLRLPFHLPCRSRQPIAWPLLHTPAILPFSFRHFSFFMMRAELLHASLPRRLIACIPPAAAIAGFQADSFQTPAV